MKSNSLQDLYVEQLKDLYSAENQLIKALPKMVEAATSDELRSAIEEHLEKTKQHAARLEKIFSRIGEDNQGPKCKGMEGLLEEGSEVIEDDEMEEEKEADETLTEIAEQINVEAVGVEAEEEEEEVSSRHKTTGRRSKPAA